jgi:FkbM family methyltransferase
MHKGLEFIDGMWWPKGDKLCRPSIMETYKDADIAIKLCRARDVVIQAGGNCGVWANYLAKKFDTVYTFEPDITNFRCLNLNAPQENVIRLQAAIGIGGPPLSMNLVNQNIGAHSMKISSEGTIPHLRIDDLMLQACDMIQLDLEGFERFALEGAEETINQFSPVLMIEDKGHHVKYGLDRGAVLEYAISLGYEIQKKINRDVILTRKKEFIDAGAAGN